MVISDWQFCLKKHHHIFGRKRTEVWALTQSISGDSSPEMDSCTHKGLHHSPNWTGLWGSQSTFNTPVKLASRCIDSDAENTVVVTLHFSEMHFRHCMWFRGPSNLPSILGLAPHFWEVLGEWVTCHFLLGCTAKCCLFLVQSFIHSTGQWPK